MKRAQQEGSWYSQSTWTYCSAWTCLDKERSEDATLHATGRSDVGRNEAKMDHGIQPIRMSLPFFLLP